MGYYSQVSIGIYKSDFDKLVSLAHEDKDIFEYLEWADSILLHQDDVVTMRWDCIKWYSSALEDFVRSTSDYHFIRVGEEHGDVEDDYAGDGGDFDIGYVDTYIENIPTSGTPIDTRSETSKKDDDEEDLAELMGNIF